MVVAILAIGMLASCGSVGSVRPDIPASTPAESVLARNDRLVIYEPVQGDTLQSIAARFLGSADRWWEIADFNEIRAAQAGRVLAVPTRALNPVGISSDRYQTVPILCYHRLGTGSGKMVVSATNFAAQLDWLARNDYRVIRFRDMREFLEGKRPLPRRAVVITFDDGYSSFYKLAYPLLRKYGFPATLFLYTDFVGAGDGLTWPQMQEMEAGGLVDIEAHSKSHPDLIQRFANESDDRYRERIEMEVRVPRDVIQQRLQKSTTSFAYPFGDANEFALSALVQNGYQLAATVTPGGNPFFAQPLMLRRTMIFGDQDIEVFKTRLQVSREIDTR